MARVFVIITQAGAGGERLVSLLDAHPAIACHGDLAGPAPGRPEPFQAFVRAAEQRRGPLDRRATNALIPAFLASECAGRQVRAAGATLSMEQIKDNPGLARWVKSGAPLAIHMARANTLRVLLARRRGSRPTAALPQGQALTAALNRIRRHDKDAARLVRELAGLSIRHEDMLENPDLVLPPVFLRLGLPAVVFASALARRGLPLGKAVENFEAVRQTLAGTPHEPLLEEPPALPAPAPLVHLHIPKTGGSSLEHLLRLNYGDTLYMAYPHLNGTPADYAALPLEHKRRCQAVSGHFTLESRALLPRSSRYVTILRHPVDRVISSYYMYLHHENHPHGIAIRKNHIGLERFADPASDFQQDNVQTKYIAGAPLERPCTEAHLDRAMHVLRHELACFGILERFQESVFLFAKTFGWTRLEHRHAGRNSKRPGREEMDRRSLAAVTRHNLFDMRLYVLAWNLFEDMARELRQRHAREYAEHMAGDVKTTPLMLYHPWRDEKGALINP